jgi:hypothetical protein
VVKVHVLNVQLDEINKLIVEGHKNTGWSSAFVSFVYEIKNENENRRYKLKMLFAINYQFLKSE